MTSGAAQAMVNPRCAVMSVAAIVLAIPTSAIFARPHDQNVGAFNVPVDNGWPTSVSMVKSRCDTNEDLLQYPKCTLSWSSS